MHRPLNPSLVERLTAHTPATALQIPPAHQLTAWHLGGISCSRDYTRYAFDVEGEGGLYASWFPVGRVHWVAHEGCWRWIASYPGGARSGLSETEVDSDRLPVLAMRRVDAFLELYGLWPDELRGSLSTKHAPEPRTDPVMSAKLLMDTSGHVLSEWSRLKSHAGGATGDRYVRVWLHTEVSRATLSPADRTRDLSQRVFPGKPHAVVLVQPSRGCWWDWEIRGGGSGKHRDKDTAAEQAFRALLAWGVEERPGTVSVSLGAGNFQEHRVG